MQAPRWLWVASSLLAFNMILVATTSIRAHFFVAQTDDVKADNASNADTAVEQRDREETTGLSGNREIANTPESDQGASVDAADVPPSLSGPVQQLPLGADPSIPDVAPRNLPHIPSLSGNSPEPSDESELGRPKNDMELLQRDPVFQEIKKMFSQEGGELESPPLLPNSPDRQRARLTAPPAEGLDTLYFARLDNRLSTATQVCKSAQALAREAAQAAKDGDQEAAQQLLNMATQLREIAAELMLRPL